MYGKRNYDYVEGAVKSDLQNARNAQKLQDAGRNIDELKSEITKLEMMVRAMFDIMKEQGVTTDQINNRIKVLLDDKIAKGFTHTDSIPCPRCGKTVRESPGTPMMGRCMFCGATAVFYPFIDEDQAASAEAASEDNNPVNDHMFDDLL
ncbi:MAG: hypothetical protein J5778_10205 [Clostridiales bacterium]|nr:hypothetical protein [Clostridiales bacterium]